MRTDTLRVWRRQDRAFSSRNTVACALLAVMVCLVLRGIHPGQAAARGAEEEGGAGTDKPTCNLNTHASMIYQMMKVGSKATDIKARLGEAMQCPDADLDYQLNYYDAMVDLRLGEVDEALKATSQAVYTAENDLDRDRATGFLEVLQGGLCKVRFVMKDDPSQAVSVRIRRPEPDPEGFDDRQLEALFPEAVRFYSAGMRDAVVEEAQARCAERTEPGLTVWLPPGRYRLSSEQILELGLDCEDLVWPVEDLGWAKHTVALSSGFRAYLPLRPQDIAMGNAGAMGFQAGYAQKLDTDWLAASVLWTAQLELMPVTIAAAGCSEGNELYGGDVCYGASDGYMLDASIGLTRPILLAHNVPLLPGITIGGAYIPVSVNPRFQPTDEHPYATANDPWFMWRIQPELKALLQFMSRKEADGFLSFDLGVGFGMGWFASELTGRGFSTDGEEGLEGFACNPTDSQDVTACMAPISGLDRALIGIRALLGVHLVLK